MSTPYLNLGLVSAYADAKRGGYTGTYDEFCALLAGIGGLQPKLTAGQNISITGNVIDTKAFPCNPNLLRNWYFGNPVDQRGGYVVPPNIGYYDAPDGTAVGSTTTYYTAAAYNSYWVTIAVSGITYYVPAVSAVRGYTGGGYCIDGWASNGGTVLISADGIGWDAGNVFFQKLELSADLPDLACTVSYLDSAGNLYSGQLAPGYTAIGQYAFSSNAENALYINKTASDARKIAAVKLEPGSVQTLAHQDANGSWALNEIPDYAEQLRRCQRYLIPLSSYQCPASRLEADVILFFVPLPVTMRALPAIKQNGFQVLSKSGEAQTGFTFSVSSLCSNGVIISAAKTGHGMTDAVLSAGTLSLLSAEL